MDNEQAMSDPAEIAKRLTKAQIKLLLAFDNGVSSRHLAASLARPIVRRGLWSRINQDGYSTWYEPTREGLAVRAALIKEIDNG